MFRIVLRVVIAFGLILQGMAGATAASATAIHHCHTSSQYDGGAPKCPCCPAKSPMSCADTCSITATVPAAIGLVAVAAESSLAVIERPRFLAAALDTPLRPPIG
ncbi:MAG TPA: hypothetical protein VI258_06365 [Rhodanobacteraceae bacterium]